jgi:hypothetical protein
MYRYKPVTLFGPNIVASEGEEWKKDRKMAMPLQRSQRYDLTPENHASLMLSKVFRKIIN